jgi:hypothetical protein
MEELFVYFEVGPERYHHQALRLSRGAAIELGPRIKPYEFIPKQVSVLA